MLKITLHDSVAELRIRLEGRLTGPWVGELRQCWRTASSTTAGRRTVLDLREVDFVSPEGQQVMTEMHAAGVQFLAATPLIQSIIEEIADSSGYATVEGDLSQGSDAVFRTHTPGYHSRTL